LYRDGVAAKVALSVSSGATRFGVVLHADGPDGETGWLGFELPTGALAGQTADIDFEIRATGFQKNFCFAVEAVD
jgi:hypothetical protein